MASLTLDEHVTTITLGGKDYAVYAVYDVSEPDKVDYYDVYHNGECLNLGDPFHEMPDAAKIQHLLLP